MKTSRYTMASSIVVRSAGKTTTAITPSHQSTRLATDNIRLRSKLDIATSWETVMHEASCGTLATPEDVATNCCPMMLPGWLLLSQTSFAELSLRPDACTPQRLVVPRPGPACQHPIRYGSILDLMAQLCTQTMPRPTNQEVSA